MLAFAKLLCLILISYLPMRLAAAGLLRPFNPVERTVLSFHLSFILYFLTGLLSFYSGGPALLLHSCPVILLSIYAIRRRFFRSDGNSSWALTTYEWQTLFVCTFAASWVVLVQSSQVTYSGGGWSGDWYEHYERALTFAGRLDLRHSFPGDVHLAARPPLFNLLAYYYMTFIGFEFSDYQIVASFLSCTVLLPAALLLARFFAPRMHNRSEGAARVYPFVALLLLLHPMTATNLIYPWTRMLTNAFVLTGCHFYLRAIFKPRYRLLPVAFLILSAAHLAHYSADVVILFVTLHAVYVTIRNYSQVRRYMLASICGPFVLNACWYAWSIAEFGLYTNASSNVTWQYIQVVSVRAFFHQQLINLKATLIPFVWQRDLAYLNPHDSSLTLYALYHKLHLYWATTLIGAVSEILLFLFLLLLLCRKIGPSGILSGGDESDEKRDRRLQMRSALILCLLAFGLSFPIIGSGHEAGIAHFSLQPVCILLFLMLLAVVCGHGRRVTATFAVLYTFQAF